MTQGEDGQSRDHSVDAETQDEHEDFEAFFRLSYPLVYSGLVLAFRDRNLAREAADEAFARAWARRRRVLRMEHPRPWVAKVAFNYALRQLKGQERLTESSIEDVPLQAVGTEEVELRHQLRATLSVLSPRQRAVIVLRYYLDLSTRETARKLGISEGAVKRYCSDALERLEALSVSPATAPPDDASGTGN